MNDEIVAVPDEEINKMEKNFMKFSEQMAGKRLKIPVPQTWETLVSKNGNCAAVWESLIIQKKLPYMAMMRNLRNILQSQIKDQVHQMVINNIQNPYLISKSMMFPLQYLNALEVVSTVPHKMSKLYENSIL